MTLAAAFQATSRPCATTGFASANTPAKTAQSAIGITIGSTLTLLSHRPFPRVRAVTRFTPATAAEMRDGSFANAETVETSASWTNMRGARSVSVKATSSARPHSTAAGVGSNAQRAATAASTPTTKPSRSDGSA